MSRVFFVIIFLLLPVCSLYAEIEKYDLKFDYVPRCHLGDVDLMSMELDRELWERRRLIVTVEGLEDNRVYLSREILKSSENYYDDYKNFEILREDLKIILPKLKQAKLVGVYICKDSAGKNKCSDKKVISYGDMEKVYHIPKDDYDPLTLKVKKIPYENKTKVTDKVYFFRPALINQNGLQLLADTNTEQEYQDIAAQYSRNQQLALSKLDSYSENIGSLAMSKKENTLKIHLPYMDTERCFPAPVSP